MTGLRTLAVAAGALATLAAADPPRQVFGVGALRRDGIVIPFAAYDGKRWVATWPAPTIRDLTIPISVGSIPKSWWGPTQALSLWQAWTASASSTISVLQPDWVDVHCARQVGLRTDYRAEAPPPPTVQPYPKDGLVVSPPQPVEIIRILEASASEVRAFMPVMLEAFNRGEREVEDRFGHPIPRRSREGVEPDVEAVYAIGATPRIYYLEATRAYRPLGRPAGECTGLAFGTGWFVREGDTVRSLDMAVDLLACNRFGASYMLPLGAMRLGDRVFWLAQFSGWNHERFAVIEIKPNGVQALVSVWGGGC